MKIERGEMTKVPFWAFILHRFGIHRKRILDMGTCYCRICGKYFDKDAEKFLGFKLVNEKKECLGIVSIAKLMEIATKEARRSGYLINMDDPIKNFQVKGNVLHLMMNSATDSIDLTVTVPGKTEGESHE